MIDLKALKENCSNCHLKEICLPSSMSVEEVERLDEIVQKRLKVKKKDTLFKLNQDFEGIYAIKSGSFKTFISDDSGNEQITGFYIQGEIIGLDGFATDKHVLNAIAIEDSHICVIKKDELESMSEKFIPLKNQIQRIMSKEIVRDNNMMLLLGNMNAEQKIATFIQNISNRLNKRHNNHLAITLRMTREEMGSYLGLTNETVSRILKKLSDINLISIDGKELLILDEDGLKQVIHQDCNP